MIILGIILILIGALLNFRHSGLVLDIGIIVLIVGCVFFVLGRIGHPVAGRGNWY